MAVNPRHTPLPASTGTVARHAPELVAGIDRNTHIPDHSCRDSLAWRADELRERTY
jgi:hypothetical protein